MGRAVTRRFPKTHEKISQSERLAGMARTFLIGVIGGDGSVRAIAPDWSKRRFPMTPEKLAHVTLYQSFLFGGAAVAERLDCSPPTKANRAQSLDGPLPDFHKWESCRTMPLAGRFSAGSPVSPDLSFRRCTILTSSHSARYISSTRMKGRGKQEIPEITRLPAASSGKIFKCENPGVSRPRIGPSSPWWKASRLTSQPPRLCAVKSVLATQQAHLFQSTVLEIHVEVITYNSCGMWKGTVILTRHTLLDRDPVLWVANLLTHLGQFIELGAAHQCTALCD
ncbi:hypothetical protein PR048_011720 [Dryococelus australis]|uniref:Uncharacterized protein n=1 Tax=Dryococelus australis TaxID=614101 RepID=A0ABQ9HMG5_9NEOP|nr:hypothetical protein PR048_011720 [Dryococelus australis]